MTTASLFHRLVGLISRTVAPREPMPPETSAVLMERLQAEFARKVDALVTGMDSGTVTIGQLVGSFPSLIKQHELAAALIGAGGVENATPEVYALAQRNVDSQLAYFSQWQAELLQQSASGQLPSSAAIAARAKLYGKSARATASESDVQARGLPPLPWYPAQATLCHGNCNCTWDIKTLDIVNGNFDCYYSTQPGEHCVTCLARARAANPLRVRHGMIVDPERYRQSQFFA